MTKTPTGIIQGQVMFYDMIFAIIVSKPDQGVQIFYVVMCSALACRMLHDNVTYIAGAYTPSVDFYSRKESAPRYSMTARRGDLKSSGANPG